MMSKRISSRSKPGRETPGGVRQLSVRNGLMLAALASLVILTPAIARADGGEGSGGGSSGGSGSSSHSGEGSGGGSSGGSGSGSHSGEGSDGGGSGHGPSSGGSDDGGSKRSGSGDDHSGRGGETRRSGRLDTSATAERTLNGGWRERIDHGRYQVFDPQGRTVIRRPATAQDYRRFQR
jgi:hypothetical protein